MAATSSSFSELVNALDNEELPVDVERWYDKEYADRYMRFFSLLGDACEYFSRPNAPYVVDLHSAKRLLNLLYAMASSSVVRLSMSHVNAKDPYMDSPLVALYLCVACCLLHVRQYGLFTGCRDFFIMEQQEIDYCMLNRLDIRHKVPLSRFTFNDVALSLLKIERSIHHLEYHPDLESYVDALDLRLCELMSHTNSTAMLDNPSYSVPLKDDGEQHHCCSTSGEYYLIVSVLAVRRELTGALPALRAEGSRRTLERQEDREMVEHLHRVFLRKCQNIHSDDADEAFVNAYKDKMTFRLEAYMFYKLNGPDARLDHASIVTQFRNRIHWDAISNEAYAPIDVHLEHPDKNCVAFRVIFMQMAELLFQQQLQISWLQFCLNGEAVHDMDDSTYADFVRRSHECPFFVQSFNDACIFYRGVLTVFGRQSVHYFHAFKEWLDIIVSEFNYVINRTQSVHLLIDYICDEARHVPTDVASSSSSTSANDDESRLSKKQLDQRRAFATFRYILSAISHEQQAADASNTFGDVDSTGLENSAVCGWS